MIQIISGLLIVAVLAAVTVINAFVLGFSLSISGRELDTSLVWWAAVFLTLLEVVLFRLGIEKERENNGH